MGNNGPHVLAIGRWIFHVARSDNQRLRWRGKCAKADKESQKQMSNSHGETPQPVGRENGERTASQPFLLKIDAAVCCVRPLSLACEEVYQHCASATGQSRRSSHVRDMSALPPTAVELVRCSETTRCAMCGRIWTPPDCNGVRHVEDQGPQLLTYIRLPDAAYVGAASLDGFSPASTSMAPRHWPKPCRSTHQVREATG